MPTPFPFVSGAVLTAANLNSISELPTRTLTGSGAAVAADSYSRVILNGTSITYTINTSTFSAGQVVEIYNANSTTATIAAGAGVTLNGAAGLTLAQYQSAQLYAISATSFLLWKSDSPTAASGLTKISGETSFSGVTEVLLDNVFTSTYTNYRLNVRYETTAATLFYQNRASGTTATTNYNYQALESITTSSISSRSSSQSAMFVGAGDTGAGVVGSFTVEIYGPQLAAATSFIVTNARPQAAYTSPAAYWAAGNHSTATAYDGFRLSVASGTTTGTYTLYGYQK